MSDDNRQLARQLREKGYKATLLSEKEPEPVRWLWPGRIPLGAYSDLAGDPGTLKSTLSFDIAARLTTGAPMPDGTESDFDGPRSVLVLASEDDVKHTVIPRIVALGGERDQVMEISEVESGERIRLINLETDLSAIRRICEKMAPPVGVVILDPIKAHLGRANTNREEDVRTALAPLVSLVEELGIAALGIRHMKKDPDETDPLYRPGGSIGFTAKARSTMIVGPDPDDPTLERKILSPVKMNLDRKPPSLAYRASETGDGFLGIKWEGKSGQRAADLLQKNGTGPSKRDQAAQFLRTKLAGESKMAGDLIEEAETLGIGKKTLQRARKDIGADTEQVEGGWKWSLSDSGRITVPTDTLRSRNGA